MKANKTGHNNGKKMLSSERLFACSNPLDAQLEDDIAQGDLDIKSHNFQQYPVHSIGRVHDDEDSKPHEVHAVGSSQQAASRKHHNDAVESAKQNRVLVQKILRALATAPLPSPDFYWAYDIDHLTLYYKDQYTGFMIIPESLIGDFTVVLQPKDSFARTLISVSTLRQAQAICHTIAWVFKDSLQIAGGLVNTNATEPSGLWT